ncbi:hypothetical protein [Pseudomonas sp. BIC9C]|uniref:hypothetical protein n=1 Tax=Pseudomonas sp. BIC9C TaxID=3078458 RepID=UPI002AD4EC0A|nr:hypothetical protein [Pseudomonas sp. BIC9C]
MKFLDWASAPVTKKIGTIIGILSGFAGLASLYLTLSPLNNHNPDLIGRWETNYSFPITDGTWSFKGLTTYLHEGKYNVGGVITLEGEVKQQKFKFSYNVIGAGTWTTDRDLLSISLISLNTLPKSVNLAGIDFSPELVAKLSGEPMRNLDSSYPSGLSDELHLQSVRSDRVILLAMDPSGKPFTIELHRQAAFTANR